ncbi:MAG TPA: triphosphoribosyl-dephospho-CoA synthase [Stellaceae bacterium]
MSSPASPERARRLQQAYVDACRLELRALKPGNVHVASEGHGMTVAQFEASALVSAPPLAALGKPVGERIHDAIAATHAAVGCNTNLGIVLLAAPLIAAAERAGANSLRRALSATLAGLTIADAEAAYDAIRLARPAGLGHADAQDVAAAPTVDLRQAMALAAGRDRIARQYADGYDDVFVVGLRRLRDVRCVGGTVEWAATRAYMDFLAAFVDSHIVRKHGADLAETVRGEAAALAARLDATTDEHGLAALAAFDASLKSRGLNPGSSADLTVASLLALACEDMLAAGR